MKTDLGHLPEHKRQHIQIIKDVLLDEVEQITSFLTGKKNTAVS